MKSLKKFIEDLDVVSGVTVGFVRSLSLVMSLYAVATIIFVDDLAPFVMSGAGMFFIGTAILCFFMAVFGGFPAPIVTTPVPVVLVMILMAESIPLEGRELFVTFCLTILGSTLLAGVLFLLIGFARIANFFRFIPFTLAAGALAGSGILILLLALSLTGLDLRTRFWEDLSDPVAFWKCISGLGFGIALIVIGKFWRKSWVIPLCFILFCLLFHGVLHIAEFSRADAIAAGFFMNVDSQESLWPAISLSDFARVDWLVVADQAFNAFLLFFVLLILTVVSYAQLELGANMEFNWHREFKLHGAANLLSFAGGGIPGGLMASATLPHIALRANTPVTSVMVSIVFVAFLVLGSDVLYLLPIPATSGFLIYVSVPLVTTWLFQSRRRMDVPEYAMLLLICATIVFVGFLFGIALGLILSLILFVVRFSQVSLVEANYSLADRRSSKLRSIPEKVIVKDYGARAQIYRLQGYIFFGNSHRFSLQLQESLTTNSDIVCVALDFRRVTGFDLSALDSLRGYIQRASTANVGIVLSSTSKRIKDEIMRDFSPQLVENLIWEEDEDGAVLAAEEILLTRFEADALADPELRQRISRSTIGRLTEHLEDQANFEELVDSLLGYGSTRVFADGAAIAVAGDTQSGMQILISGHASVKTSQGSTLYQLGSGDIVELRSAVSPHVATMSTIAEGECTTLLLGNADLDKLANDDLDLALAIYKYALSIHPSEDVVRSLT